MDELQYEVRAIRMLVAMMLGKQFYGKIEQFNDFQDDISRQIAVMPIAGMDSTVEQDFRRRQWSAMQEVLEDVRAMIQG